MNSNNINQPDELSDVIPVTDISTVNDPDDPSWNSWAAVAVWVASVMAIMLIPTLFLVPYLATSGLHMSDSKELSNFAITDPTAVIIQIASVIPAHLLTMVLVWAVVTGFGQRPFFASLGWSFAGIKWWHYVLMLFAFMVLSIILVSIFPLKPDQMDLLIKSSKNALYMISVVAVLSAPIVEEAVYRGVMYSAFQRSVGKATAIGLVTFLFTIVHVLQYFENPAKILLILLLSLGLTLLRAYTGSLLPSVILHFLINATQSALSIAEPYITDGPIPEVVNNLAK